jgi:hypothetical protein
MSSKMNRDAYLHFHENFCNASRALSAQKNNDYAGRDGDEPFANFTRADAMLDSATWTARRCGSGC